MFLSVASIVRPRQASNLATRQGRSFPSVREGAVGRHVVPAHSWLPKPSYWTLPHSKVMCFVVVKQCILWCLYWCKLTKKKEEFKGLWLNSNPQQKPNRYPTGLNSLSLGRISIMDSFFLCVFSPIMKRTGIGQTPKLSSFPKCMMVMTFFTWKWRLSGPRQSFWHRLKFQSWDYCVALTPVY